MKAKTTILGLGLVLAAFQPAAALAHGIAAITFDGDGCPGGTVGQSITADRHGATLIFDRFVASVGPGVDLEEDAKACNITITLTGSGNFVAEVQSRGYVQLDSGVEAAAHQHVIQAKQGLARAHFDGPLARDYLIADQVAVRRNAGGPHTLKVRLKVELDADSGRGQMTIDSLDIRLGS